MDGLGDIPADYGSPHPGAIYAPYDPSGPLGAVDMPKLTGKVLARAQFLTWLKSFNPAFFEAAINHAEDWKATLPSRTQLSGLGEGDTTPTTWWQKFSEGITSLGTAYLAYKGQQNVLNTNLQRAQMGLPPIDPSTGAPTVRTQVSLSPQLLSRLQESATPILLFGGLGILALILLTRGRSRR